MNEKEELKAQIAKHTLLMTKAISKTRLILKDKAFKELYDSAIAYYEDSKHFFMKKKYVQSFEALMISWAYLDSGLKLGVFELTDESMKKYFTLD
ncbi:MAG: DUF357 domain-containing protein [Candidatus Nanoarchaeia archaeon]|jgi:hypothetical protein